MNYEKFLTIAQLISQKDMGKKIQCFIVDVIMIYNRITNNY